VYLWEFCNWAALHTLPNDIGEELEVILVDFVEQAVKQMHEAQIDVIQPLWLSPIVAKLSCTWKFKV
jgi:hypothetical protein